MEQDTIKNFTARISQANRSELIVILYDIAIQDIREAMETSCMRTIEHASKCVNELIVSLDYSYEISFELLRLYRYVNERLLRAKSSKESDLLVDALEVMQELRVSFVEVAKQDTSDPVMRNTEQVYAGLTYSRGVLNEARLYTTGERGFRA